MKVIVPDTSVLIDLERGSLLEDRLGTFRHSVLLKFPVSTLDTERDMLALC